MCCFVMSKMNLPIDMRHWFEERLTMQQSTGERSMFLRQNRNGISSWGLHIFACCICNSLYSHGSFRTFFIDQYLSFKDSWNLLDPEAACESSSSLWTCDPHIPPSAGLPGTGQTHSNIQKKVAVFHNCAPCWSTSITLTLTLLMFVLVCVYNFRVCQKQ